MQTQQTTTQQGINVLLSSIVQGRNPRTYFDPVEMEDLTASVRSQGVIQPILFVLCRTECCRSSPANAVGVPLRQPN